MDIVSGFSAVVGIPPSLEGIVKLVHNVWLHIGYISDNPKLKAALEERVKILQGILASLETEPDDAIAKLITDNLEELVRSVSTTRESSTWLNSSAHHARLQEAERKLQHLITQCTVLHKSQQSASTVFNRKLDPTSCKVGLDRSAAHILTFLKGSEASMVRVIVIYGQAGIGKTTLLNSIWDDASSKAPFRARVYVQVGEHPTREDITKLQSDICEQLDKQKLKFPTEDFGKGALVDRFQKLKGENKPVFLAIDNILQVEHLTSLLPSKLTLQDMPSSTCIVVTCRDRKIGDAILRICHLEAENCSQVLFFEPPYLDPQESKEVFAECAGMELTDLAHQDLLHALVPLCGGLPLALKVLGGIFVDKTRRKPKEWQRIKHQWTTFDDSGDPYTSLVSKAFHSSYALLHPSRQVAFLDIVSSYYGWPWELVEAIVGEEVMKNLRESSLISKVDRVNQCSESALSSRIGFEVDQDQMEIAATACISGYVWVHDLTLRLGESITNDEVNGQEHQLGYVEHFFTDIGDLPEVTKLRNLILTISAATSSRQFSALLSYLQEAKSLQMLIVRQPRSVGRSNIRYSLVSNTKPQHLRYFSHTGQWNEGWNEGWSNFLRKVSPEIRFIRLCHGAVLELLPNMPHLQMLVVRCHRDLQKIGKLPNLKSLFLDECESLEKLSDCVGCMEYLEKLHVLNCKSLVELPENLGKMRSLQNLFLYRCKSLTKLTESVECMESLKELTVEYCDSLLELPTNLGKLRSLKTLRLCGCKSLKKLPESVEYMESLEELRVQNCDSLLELPTNLGKLRSLKTLDLYGCKSLTKLPKSVGCMESLKELSVARCDSLLELPTNLGKLRSLKTLSLYGCKSLTTLPESVGCMESLEHLVVENYDNLLELPTNLGKLRSLKRLFLHGCKSSTKLPESVGCMEYLEKLWVTDCDSLLELLANLGKLRSLKTLSLNECKSLTTLPESVGCMESLEELRVMHCNNLLELPTNLGKLRSLKTLKLDGCKSLTTLPESVGCMESLEELQAVHCDSLLELPANLGKLRSLKRLILSQCKRLTKLLESVGCMESLAKLWVEDCESLLELPANLEKLRSLKSLRLYGCKSLTMLPESVGCMESLAELWVEDCESLLELPANLEKLRSLKSLRLSGCKSLRMLPESVGCMESLEELQAMNCYSLLELPANLEKLRSLKSLILSGCKRLTKLPESVGCMESLEELRVQHCDNLLELPANLGKLRSLKTLDLFGCKSLTKLPESVGCMESLEKLWVCHCESLLELPTNLGKLRSLKTLELYGCKSLTKLPESVSVLVTNDIYSLQVNKAFLENLQALNATSFFSREPKKNIVSFI